MKIGLMLPIGQQELLAGPDRWSLFREMALATESSGLDSVWCADHLLFRHDETAEPGRVYYYVVTAVDDAGNESPFSMEVSITYPQAPLDVLPYVAAAGGAAILGIGGYLMWRRAEVRSRSSTPLRRNLRRGSSSC